MLANTVAELRDQLHALFCYQLFITPLPLRVEKEYRLIARQAIEFLTTQRTSLITRASPRHHVIHHFAQPNADAKKILITHGWMSRAAYMAKMINTLYQQGYEIYALDFPAHGEATGWQLPWIDAVAVIRETINNFGPFHAVMGHSFGGSMLLSTMNLSTQLPEWELASKPEKIVLLASPIRMRRPITRLASRFRMSRTGLRRLQHVICEHSQTHLNRLSYGNFIRQHDTPVLCVHGQKDVSVDPQESILFCRSYPHASLALLPEINHTDILFNEEVAQKVSDFLR